MRRLWLLGLAVWIVLGLMSAAQNAAWRAYVDRPIDWGSILPNALSERQLQPRSPALANRASLQRV